MPIISEGGLSVRARDPQRHPSESRRLRVRFPKVERRLRRRPLPGVRSLSPARPPGSARGCVIPAVVEAPAPDRPARQLGSPGLRGGSRFRSWIGGRGTCRRASTLKPNVAYLVVAHGCNSSTTTRRRNTALHRSRLIDGLRPGASGFKAKCSSFHGEAGMVEIPAGPIFA